MYMYMYPWKQILIHVTGRLISEKKTFIDFIAILSYTCVLLELSVQVLSSDTIYMFL